MEITPTSKTTAATDQGVPPGGAPVTPDALPPVGPVRRALAGMAMLAALPYLVLKIGWLAGARTGLADEEFGRGASMDVLNALTMTLDVVALALALVFVTRRGLRAPAWLVLPPMWVGAGLLGQILVALPVATVVDAFSPARPSAGAPPPIEQWVFTMVYAGFGLLGVGLLGAFAIYARQRWGGREVRPVTARQRRALTGAAGLVSVGAVAHVVLAGVPLGSRLLDLGVAAVCAGSLLALGRPRQSRRAGTVGVVLAFVTTGAVTAWATYLLVITAVPNDLVGQTAVDWPTLGSQALRAASGFAGVAALGLRLRDN